jgi:hypothetical protein
MAGPHAAGSTEPGNPHYPLVIDGSRIGAEFRPLLGHH